jgi:hypothetical protein
VRIPDDLYEFLEREAPLWHCANVQEHVQEITERAICHHLGITGLHGDKTVSPKGFQPDEELDAASRDLDDGIPF